MDRVDRSRRRVYVDSSSDDEAEVGGDKNLLAPFPDILIGPTQSRYTSSRLNSSVGHNQRLHSSSDDEEEEEALQHGAAVYANYSASESDNDQDKRNRPSDDDDDAAVRSDEAEEVPTPRIAGTFISFDIIIWS